MLQILDALPEGLLDLEATQLHTVIPGPTLVHLHGRRPEPLFVSVLLHGNETSGWDAMRQILAQYRDQNMELPRSLSLLIGNVEAAREGRRHLDHQPDFNRVWGSGESAEHKIMAAVVDEMRRRKVALSIDIHNNTGLNPHYGCVNSLDPRFLQLARLFSRNIVYFLRPDSVQSMAFAALCPAVTVECGRVGFGSGADHAAEFVRAALNISELPDHPIAPHDIDVFHTVATVRVEPECRFAFSDDDAELRFAPALDRLNFVEVEARTELATWSRDLAHALSVSDEEGVDVTEQYFAVEDGRILFRKPVIPAMITLDTEVIRQDCLCYLMERYPWHSN